MCITAKSSESTATSAATLQGTLKKDPCGEKDISKIILQDVWRIRYLSILALQAEVSLRQAGEGGGVVHGRHTQGTSSRATGVTTKGMGGTTREAMIRVHMGPMEVQPLLLRLRG